MQMSLDRSHFCGRSRRPQTPLNTRMDIEKVIADAHAAADRIFSESADIRSEFEQGHPNCSTEATAEGAIRAMALWMEIDAAV